MKISIGKWALILGIIGFLTTAYPQVNDKMVSGFFDLNYQFTDGPTNGFTLGQFDTYSAGNIVERLSYLTELVVEFGDGWIVDLERISVKYFVNDYLSAGLGKYHTPLGYWNTAYHHGALLHPSVDRPLCFRFEDEGGILPIHTTGLNLSGRNIGPARMGYEIMVGNGIGSTPVLDNDNYKSMSILLTSQFADGFTAGISGYHDLISKGAVVEAHGEDSISEDLDHNIGGVSVAIEKGEFSLVAEEIIVMTQARSGGNWHSSSGRYVLLAYTFGMITPFLKYDYLKIKGDDPFLPAADKQAFSGGVKYEINYLAAVKAQYTFLQDNGDQNKFAFQIAVGF